jgi:hypothetical protein
MDHPALKARVLVLVRCIATMPALFAQGLRDDQWAAILQRSPRWFATAKKAGIPKKGGSNGN